MCLQQILMKFLRQKLPPIIYETQLSWTCQMYTPSTMALKLYSKKAPADCPCKQLKTSFHKKGFI